jgi:hypothetical protein
LTLKPEFEDQEIFDSRTGVRSLADTTTTKTTLTLAATMKMLTGRVRALALASNLNYENQVAHTTTQVAGLSTVQVGGIVNCEVLNMAIVSVTDTSGSPVAYTSGTHYEADTEAGLVKVLAHPGGSNTAVKVNYTNPAIALTALRPRIGLANQPDLRGGLIIRGTNQVGVRTLTKLPSVRFRPSGERNYATEDYVQVEVEGKVLIDSTQAAGEELGYEQTLD